MKNFILSVFFLGLAGYLGWILYEREFQTDVVESPTAASQVWADPVQMDIERVDGRKISVTLLARNDTHIQFIRESDGKRYTYPIRSLSERCKELVEAYPIVVIQGMDAELANQNAELGDVYVSELRERVQRIDETIKSLRHDYKSSSSQVEKRTISRKIQDLMSEREGHEAEIEQRI